MFSEKIHRSIFLFGACSLAFGMMVGTVPTSIPQMILLGNWLLEFNFKQKLGRLRSNSFFWIMASVFFMHVLGLLYTQNIGAGCDDVRTKIPLLILPLIFFTARPLALKELYMILSCFLAGCLVNTCWCMLYSFVLHNNEVGRNASRFMSHIRLGLYLNMAIACCIYFASLMHNHYKKAGLLLLALYFVLAMYVLGLASGLANFLILSFLGVCVIVYNQKVAVKIISFLVLIICTVFIILYISGIAKMQLSVNSTSNNQQAQKSQSGRPYYIQQNTRGQIENGNYVLLNIQPEELKKEWQHIFPNDSFSYYPNTHNINRYEVLIRYLASRGLNKDSAGISKLSAQDKVNIQKDICNYRYPEWNYLHKRVYELVCEYDDYLNNRDVNGHSLTMRVYFWEAALQVIAHHSLAGVGTGDVQAELNKVYDTSHSPLEKEWYKRPHNQFLTITVALGILGLVIFLSSILYPAIVLRKYLHPLYWPFFILAIVSFMLEDTLETQAGLSFYAVFNTLFITFAYFKKNNEANTLPRN